VISRNRSQASSPTALQSRGFKGKRPEPAALEGCSMKISTAKTRDLPREESRGPSHRNLLRGPTLEGLLRARGFPGLIQYLVLLLFLLLMLWAFMGSPLASRNPATLTVWSLWWPLLPLSFFLFGRLWCAVCPLGTVGDVAQKALGGGKRLAPGAFLKAMGPWIMLVLFVVLTWADRIFGFAGSPRATGALLLLLTGGTLAAMVLYRRRSWCRYLCPLGGLSGLYSMCSIMELRPHGELCRKTCRARRCSRGEVCPVFEHPPALASSQHCILCGSCVKQCPHGGLSWRFRAPFRELASLEQRAPAEGLFALILVMLVFIQTASMSSIFPQYMKRFIEGTFIKSYHLAFSINFIGLLAVGAGLFVICCSIGTRSSREPFRVHFSSFGYALIPLGLAGHLAHNLYHLKEEGKGVLLALWGIFSMGGIRLSGHQTAAGTLPTIRWMQVGIVLLGMAASMWITVRLGGGPREGSHGKRIPWASRWPYLLLALILGAAFVLLFFLPMNPRHFH